MQTKQLEPAERLSTVAPKSAPGQAVGAPDAETNVNKIRDILFGGQMRDYERRFGEISTRIEADSARLRLEVQERLGRLESFIRQELEAGAARMQRESRERAESIEALRKSVEAADKALG
jgi:predicted nucleotidyltransferase